MSWRGRQLQSVRSKTRALKRSLHTRGYRRNSIIHNRCVVSCSNIWRDCVDGYYDWVKEHILDGAPLNEADHCGDPPLILAAGNGHKTCVKLLLDEGADIEQRNVMKETALIRAAHNGHLHTVRYLLERGAQVDALDLGDNTALHWAAMRGHVEVVRVLVAAGADRQATNGQGRTPLDLCKPQWSVAYKFVRTELTR